MAYCTVDEIFGAVKEDALNTMLGTDYIEDLEERKKAVTHLIAQAIEDADAEINGYLAKRYEVPLKIIPKVLNKFSKDISVYNLASRSGIQEDSGEKTVLTRYNAAIKFLENVAKGLIEIGVTKSQEAAATGFNMKSSKRLFSRESMKGW